MRLILGATLGMLAGFLSSCDEGRESGVKGPEVDYKEIGKKEGVFQWQGKPFTGTAYTNHPDGTRAQEMPMRDGQFHGVVREWYEGGAPKVETNFVDGRRHGSNRYWYPDGTLMKTQVYDNDHPVEEHYFDHGKPVEH
jgi:antitoxin component YwqK of YwqJK toxin-antitoxin module